MPIRVALGSVLALALAAGAYWLLRSESLTPIGSNLPPPVNKLHVPAPPQQPLSTLLQGPLWKDDFQSGLSTDAAKGWAIVSAGDFKERTVDVLDVRRQGTADQRLRLRANTMGTDDKTVKFVGARLRPKIQIQPGVELAWELDWNEQANGCYLAAGVVLSVEESDGNPEAGDNWLKIEYVGVPPGKNARLQVMLKHHGRLQSVFTEGWPQINRAGRKIGLQKLSLQLKPSSLTLKENGTLLYQTDKLPLSLEAGWLYLQLSSHSNYPAREVYFDNVEVKTIQTEP